MPTSPEPDLSWTWSAGVLVALAALLAVYAVRWWTVRPSVWRLVSFALGVAALFVASASPIARLGEQLFVAHMAQHILLLDAAPILMIAGLTPGIVRPVTARLRGLAAASHRLWHPAVAVLAYAGMLWIWHIPAMYELALRHGAVHVVQHLLFIGVGLLFWGHVLAPRAARERLRGPRSVVFLGAAKILTGVLASAIAFSPLGAYGFYADQPRWWGLTPTDDQRAAGGLMMTEELTIMTVAVVLLFIRMLGESEREEARRERLLGES